MTDPAPPQPLKLLILGGSTEASKLIRLIDGDDRVAPILSLAGRTKSPKLPQIPYRIGGFTGIDGLVAYLTAKRIDAVIDATHPFADLMTGNAAVATGRVGVPLLRVDRPAWTPVEGDDWTMASDMAAAAEALGADAKRVFLTIGQKDLEAFRAAPQHHYVIRSVDAPDPGACPQDCEVITATGPFELDDERALLEAHDIEVMVTKNSGGTATAAKLTAAREANIPVIMIERPAAPDVPTVATAEQARQWLDDLLAARH